jgi:hypothetical protein
MLRLSLIFNGKGSVELRAIRGATALANECAVARPILPDAPVMKPFGVHGRIW